MSGVNTAQQVRQAAERQFDELVALRRYLHENAEPSKEEKTASALVKQEARALGLPYETWGSMVLWSRCKGAAKAAVSAFAPTWMRFASPRARPI